MSLVVGVAIAIILYFLSLHAAEFYTQDAKIQKAFQKQTFSVMILLFFNNIMGTSLGFIKGLGK